MYQKPRVCSRKLLVSCYNAEALYFFNCENEPKLHKYVKYWNFIDLEGSRTKTRSRNKRIPTNPPSSEWTPLLPSNIFLRVKLLSIKTNAFLFKIYNMIDSFLQHLHNSHPIFPGTIEFPSKFILSFSIRWNASMASNAGNEKPGMCYICCKQKF